MTQPILNIVTALACEAKPLIDYFQLKKIADRHLPFIIFVNAEKTIYLIVTGIGKIKCAAGVAFLASFTGNRLFTSFLNIGIAGSQQFSVGELLVANKIIESSTKRAWYPIVLPLKNKRQTKLITEDLPQNTYPLEGMIDMEGSAFFQAASCFVSHEFIQSVKVISDNNIQSQAEINKTKVSHWVENNLREIAEIAAYLIELSARESRYEEGEEELNRFYATWHFTHSEKLQLKEFLRRWKGQMSQDVWPYCQQEKSARHVIHKIMTTLDEYASCLS